jgi:hypothetical protein
MPTHRSPVQVNLVPSERKDFLLASPGIISERDNRLEVFGKRSSKGYELAMLKKALSGVVFFQHGNIGLAVDRFRLQA